MNYYTDGSYSPQKKIGVAGFMVNDQQIYLKDTTEKNTQCEYLAVTMALKHAIKEGNNSIKIFTDCAGVINTINKNKRAKYPELFALLDKLADKQINVEWIKVKGHSKKANKNEDDLNFQKIDKAVRKKLRNSMNNIVLK